MKEITIDTGADKLTVIDKDGMRFVTRKEQLRECIISALVMDKKKYIGVAIANTGMDGIEIIINGKENFLEKLEYYVNAYTDNLTLKTYDGIKIVNFAAADTFEELREQLEQ